MRDPGYAPHTPADRARMLAAVGAAAVEELFADIPEALRGAVINLPAGLEQQPLAERIDELAAKNRVERVSFLGAGAYRHWIPPVVDHLVGRGEFATAYTPYQAEISQGTLQTIYEYQSLVAALTGLDVVSASHYDGATATAEAALMALRVTRRDRLVISAGLHPHYRQTLATYAAGRFRIDEVPLTREGVTDLDALERATATGPPPAAVLVAQPNFVGCLEAMHDASALSRAAAALFVAVVEPVSLAVLTPPGDYGADIAAGEGQPLGIPLSYGGPYLGLLACTDTLVRQLPGRLVSTARDAHGRDGYVMTLRAREQDIRRERAASNICTNQALCALTATVYLAALGPDGLTAVAAAGAARAGQMEQALAAVGVHRLHTAPYLNEFAVPVADAERVHAALFERGVLAGLPLAAHGYPDTLLLCATETTTSEDVEQLAAALAKELP